VWHRLCKDALNMDVALLSDIHANLYALHAVFSALDKRGAERAICAGDLVGYNAMPRETLASLRARGVACVYGNHDLMASGIRRVVGVGPRATRGALWTRSVLSDRERDELRALPATLRWRPDAMCVHAAPDDVDVRLERADQFRVFAAVLRAVDPELRIYVHGHTHKPRATYVSPHGDVETAIGDTVTLAGDGIWFINPGAVGEPHDVDSRAHFATFNPDTRVVQFHHVAYDAARVSLVNLLRFPPLEELGPTRRIASSLRAAARALTVWL
jgi:predicted phosphodiesterase